LVWPGPPRVHARVSSPRRAARAGRRAGEPRAGEAAGDAGAPVPALEPTQRGDQGPALRIPRGRVLAGPGLRRVSQGHLGGGPVPYHRQPLLSVRDAVAGARRAGGPDRRRPARAEGERVAPAARRAASVRDRALPARGRDQPRRVAQPPRDLRADPPLDGPPAGATGRRRLATVALAPEHE